VGVAITGGERSDGLFETIKVMTRCRATVIRALDGGCDDAELDAAVSLRVRTQLEPLEIALATRHTSTHADLAHRAHSIRCAA
jgi:hypothetical protein